MDTSGRQKNMGKGVGRCQKCYGKLVVQFWPDGREWEPEDKKVDERSELGNPKI